MSAIKLLASQFVREHWDEIDKKKTEITEPLGKVLKLIHEDADYAGWIVAEMMNWGCKTDYRVEYVVENPEEDFIMQIGDSYFRLDRGNPFAFEEVKPVVRHIKVISFEKIEHGRRTGQQEQG